MIRHCVSLTCLPYLTLPSDFESAVNITTPFPLPHGDKVTGKVKGRHGRQVLSGVKFCFAISDVAHLFANLMPSILLIAQVFKWGHKSFWATESHLQSNFFARNPNIAI